jgi:site-specific DNA-methyltransferase (adenine-specific)
MMNNNYNPDVLNCIANLSNDEVFTPPELANKMLDLLPQELFRSSKTTFLDPFTKSGVFLREIVKRLDRGLAEKIPDRQKRIDHILHNQVFGIACTELTSLLARRSVYCSKTANGKYSISKFDTQEGNILYKNIKHTWVNGKCKYCGASQSVYDRGSEAEQYAYMFIHTDNPKQFFKNMKFDVIIGNPPYQLSDGSGGSTDAAMPIYNKFITQCKIMTPHFIVMITPSKWMVGGRGLQSFREEMLNDKRIRHIYDYEQSSECFEGLHIDGGVSYFLWDHNYSGPVTYVYKPKGQNDFTTVRTLRNKYSNIVIRDNRRESIIEKVSKATSFSIIVSPRKPFNVNTDLFNCPERYPELKLSENKYPRSVLIWGVKGLKGGAKRVCGYVAKDSIDKNVEWINKHKLFISKAYSTDAIIPPKFIEAGINEICTETFLVIGPFNNIKEMQNCLTYTETNFFRILLYFGRGTMQVSQEVFRFVPLQDFSHPWTDEMLYKKYNLNEDEIAFIESMIRPME